MLLWLILGWLFYRDKHTCCTGEMDVSAIPVTTQKTGPILFSYNNSNPIIGEGWLKMRDSLTQFANDTSSLEITGWYCTNLTPPENEAIGLSRAAEVRKQFSNVPDDHIILISKAVDCDNGRVNINEEAVSFAARIRTANIKETISLTGHTDDVGSDASNILLGRKRADIVKSYLVAQGVSVSKINVDSKGESMPVAENTTDEGRAKNRRTELKIIK